MKRVRIGIDLGKNGAIAIIEEGEMEVLPMPTINKKEFDIQEIASIFIKYTDTEEYDVHVVYEDVKAIFGASAGATFDFGRGKGIFEGVLASYGIPRTPVAPKKWQKQMFEGVKETRKPASAKQKALGRRGGIDTKAMALIAVKRLYPNLKLTFGPRAKKPHDGLVDAVLLARYCNLNF